MPSPGGYDVVARALARSPQLYTCYEYGAVKVNDVIIVLSSNGLIVLFFLLTQNRLNHHPLVLLHLTQKVTFRDKPRILEHHRLYQLFCCLLNMDYPCILSDTEHYIILDYIDHSKYIAVYHQIGLILLK